MSLIHKINQFFIVESKTLEITRSRADFISYLKNQNQTLNNQGLFVKWIDKKQKTSFTLEIEESKNKKNVGFFSQLSCEILEKNNQLYLTSNLCLKQVFKVYILSSPIQSLIFSYIFEGHSIGISILIIAFMLFQYGKLECQKDANKYFRMILLLTKSRGNNEDDNN